MVLPTDRQHLVDRFFTDHTTPPERIEIDVSETGLDELRRRALQATLKGPQADQLYLDEVLAVIAECGRLRAGLQDIADGKHLLDCDVALNSVQNYDCHCHFYMARDVLEPDD